MEFFNKAKPIRLRSHLDKYLLAEADGEKVRQSRNESSRKIIWNVEFVDENSHLIRLKSCCGHYLAATEEPFLLGMTGKKVLQASPPPTIDGISTIEWEPIRDGFQVKLRSRNGTFLRANGAMVPWRNSITHDIPQRSSTHNWVLWDVIQLDSYEPDRSFSGYESQLSTQSSFSDSFMDSPTSPWSIESANSPIKRSTLLGMEFFRNAKSVRLKGHHSKYLVAEEDEESVTQDRNGSSKTARWTVEFMKDGSFIRLKSCFGKYLTASNSPFLLGMTGRKVTQSLPHRLDSSLEWEPVKDGYQVKLKTRYGNFLRANGGLPPWRNSVTHDVPHRTATQEWVLWDVDVLEIQVHADSPKLEKSESELVGSWPGNDSSKHLTKVESGGSFVKSFQKPVDGRIIEYSIVDDDAGYVEDAVEGGSFTFKGKGVEELTKKLEEETGLVDIIVCSRNPLNGQLYPLRLQLPPNNTKMQVVVVPRSSRAASDFS